MNLMVLSNSLKLVKKSGFDNVKFSSNFADFNYDGPLFRLKRSTGLLLSQFRLMLHDSNRLEDVLMIKCFQSLTLDFHNMVSFQQKKVEVALTP